MPVESRPMAGVMVTSTATVWADSLVQIRKRVNLQAYQTWFCAVWLEAVEGDGCTVAVPNPFFVEMMADPYSDLILETVSAALGRSVERPLVRVDFVVREGGVAPTVPIAEMDGVDGAAGMAATAGATTDIVARPTMGSAAGSSARSARSAQSTPRSSIQPANRTGRDLLNPKYTFDEFVVGGGNQFAHAAARAVADAPGKAYNPIFIYGDVGLGKTHLLHAIGSRIRDADPDRRICYVSSEQFTNEVINSIRYDRMADFRARYRNGDVLIIDDIQFIAGKDRTQEEFFHTFNTLYQSGRQIVLSSDRFPKEMPGIEERLRSRFEWGLIADIQPPDLETRIAILQKKAESERIDLPGDVAELLATEVRANVRVLEGALIRLGAYASLTGREVTLDMARETLRDVIRSSRTVVTVEHVLQVVATHYQIRVADLKGKRRTKGLTGPRQIAMYLCRDLTELSYPDIGRGFGGRDHSTVMYACRQVGQRMAAEPEVRATVGRLSRSVAEAG